MGPLYFDQAERLKEERAHFLTLPTEAFEARRIVAATANSISLVRFETNSYSVPTTVAHHDVTVVTAVDEAASSPEASGGHSRAPLGAGLHHQMLPPLCDPVAKQASLRLQRAH